MISNLRRQARDLRGWNVRRISDDQIQITDQAPPPVANHETGTMGQTQSVSIAPSQLNRRQRDIDANPPSLLPFHQNGQQQTTGPGAKISDPKGSIQV